MPPGTERHQRGPKRQLARESKWLVGQRLGPALKLHPACVTGSGRPTFQRPLRRFHDHLPGLVTAADDAGAKDRVVLQHLPKCLLQ